MSNPFYNAPSVHCGPLPKPRSLQRQLCPLARSNAILALRTKVRLSIAFLIAISSFAAPVGAGTAFVRVSPRDHRYLELTDGTPYIPIGLNMISPPGTKAGEEAALRGMEAWLASLSANSCSWRVIAASTASGNASRLLVL